MGVQSAVGIAWAVAVTAFTVTVVTVARTLITAREAKHKEVKVGRSISQLAYCYRPIVAILYLTDPRHRCWEVWKNLMLAISNHESVLQDARCYIYPRPGAQGRDVRPGGEAHHYHASNLPESPLGRILNNVEWRIFKASHYRLFELWFSYEIIYSELRVKVCQSSKRIAALQTSPYREYHGFTRIPILK